MTDFVANFELEQNNIEANFGLENVQFDAVFQINPTGAAWGDITGNIEEQTDLINILNDKVEVSDFEELSQTVADNYNALDGRITINTNNISSITDIITNYGDIVTHNAADFATASQGAMADTSIQPNDNITLLNNNAGYITNSALNGYATETYVNSQGFITIDALDGYATEDFVTSQGYITGIDNSDVVNALGYTPYDSSNPAGYITSASLPTVNNNTITIQKNSVTVDSFTLNQSSNKIINITVPTTASDVGALPNTTNYAASIDLSLNTTDYKLTLTLKDQNGNTLNSKVVDFPIESVVVNGRYDSTNKKIVLTLQNGTTIDIPVGDLVAGLQTEITSTNKLDADLVDDTNATNKFVTANEKTTWNNKQNAISDLSTIRTNAANGANAYTTIQGYGDIVTHNASDFVTPSSLATVLADYVLSSDLSTTLANYVTSANLTTILDDYATQQWVNNQGYITGITSNDVTTALGFTPYNATNPNGYITSSALTPYALISSLSTVATSGLYSDLTGLPTIPTMTSQLTNNSGFITSADLPTNYLTTDTAQDVSGRKTFLGEKAIYFKQIATSNKLGFTLYNPNNSELGALEYRPSTIGTSSLLAINCPQTTGGYVGFRYWGTPAVNIVAPKVATAGNYYIPTHITNGTNTVTADNQGTVNISTLLPDVSNYVTDTSLATTLADYVTNSALTTTLSDYALQSDIPDISTKQDTLVSGTNIKTVNGISVLGSGNIDTSEIFVANYGTTTHQEVLDAYNAGKLVYCPYEYTQGLNFVYVLTDVDSSSVNFQCIKNESRYVLQLDNDNSWWKFPPATFAFADLSNLSATGQAVIDGQWVSDTSNIVSSNITVTTSYSNNWSLASYLPNDNYNYEVLFSIYGTTATHSGATLDLRMGTDLILDDNNDAGVMALRGQTRTNSSMGYANCLILPVGTDRKVYIKSYGTGVLSVLRVQAYRRLGTNS